MVVGAAAARMFSETPTQAFFIGWLSHYIMDAIAHWDYPLRSFSADEHSPLDAKVTFNKYLFLDIGKVLLDVALGVIVIFLVAGTMSWENLLLLFVGAIGGALPDFLQFLLGVTRLKALRIHQQFHNFMHATHKLDDKPLIGITSQVLIIGAACALIMFF